MTGKNSIRHGLFLLLILLASSLLAQRVPVLNQIDLPHSYYYRELYLPQLTAGPSSVAWMPDGKSLVYSMAGNLWRQVLGNDVAEQLTDDDGYDYQPDVSPDGNQILFTRYTGASLNLMLLDLEEKKTYILTEPKSVSLEPRWSPDGKKIAFVSTYQTGHFLLHTATIGDHLLSEIRLVIPEHKNEDKLHYYYSTYDHAINPAWSRDGRSIYFVSNRGLLHGAGNLVAVDLRSGEVTMIQREETSWHMRPDISPDGTRIVYSSYLGQNWNQLWALPAKGGYPVPLTYGDYDKTAPRWSPDGNRISFISNRDGNTALWIQDAFNGKQQPVTAKNLKYLLPHTTINLQIQDQDGNIIPARISVTDSREKFYAPKDAWIHADDSRYPAQAKYEAHYFHCQGTASIEVPIDKLSIQVSHGPAYEIVRKEVSSQEIGGRPIIITVHRLPVPPDFGNWWSGDVHVHMNYTGTYKNTPARLVAQANAEDLNFVYNLIVNKEQRIPDVQYFSGSPDVASTDKVMLLHGQEFHTSFWGHLGLLNMKDHLILPDYSGYAQTAMESLFPHNSFIADRAHEQQGLVGYVHPFEISDVFPGQSDKLSSLLPVDAVLGKADYYELMGFSDHRATEAVWYQLLNSGLKIPAAAGTDAMANYASLRGPVGLVRVYVRGAGPLNSDSFLTAMRKGKSFVTNGPILGFSIGNAHPGDSLLLQTKEQTLEYNAFLRSNTPMDHVEVIMNGEVVASLVKNEPIKSIDFRGKIKVHESGWILLRSWNSTAQPEIQDIYPYASTNPIYFQGSKKSSKSKPAGEFFLKWVDRLEKLTRASETFRDEAERSAVLNDIAKSRVYYERCVKE
jgi:TolB protein